MTSRPNANIIAGIMRFSGLFRLSLFGLLAVAAAIVPPLSRAADDNLPSNPADTALEKLADEFLDGYFAARPLQAVGYGLHQYDGQFSDLRRASLDAEVHRLKDYAARFDKVNASQLGASAALDLRLLKLTIAGELFNFEDINSFTKNPMTYAGAMDVNVYLKRDFAPLAERLKSIVAIERQAPASFAAAHENLADILPKPQVQLGIIIAKGTADFLAHDLVEAVKDVKDDALQADFKAANAKAVAGFQAYAEWLTQEKLPKADNSYVLGEEKYRRMLAASEAITLAPEKILEIGLAELKREQAEFTAAAKLIDPNKPAIEVFKEIQHDHPTAENLIPDTKKNLESIRQFLIDHQIIDLPSEVRATVMETPKYLRAGSFASMDSPGPFETKGAQAYYYVTPVEPEWSDQEKDEWLTAFNHYTADVISIHEAYPGHYVQFLHSKATPLSKTQKIFWSYAFGEGWAHYSEQMVLDEGFGKVPGAKADDLQYAKYRLAQSDEALLRICRLCVSIKMHTQGMSVEDGAKFINENCYYEPKPAMQEALRGTFDPGYLFYTLGKLQLLKLRRDWQAQEGDAYSLKRFNDAVTDHGAPPVRFLREILLKDPAKADEIL